MADAALKKYAVKGKNIRQVNSYELCMSMGKAARLAA
jgi:hypothetical protein